MSVTPRKKQRYGKVFLSIFGLFFALPGVGLLLFKAVPELPRLWAPARLSGDALEALIAASIVGLVFSVVGTGLVYMGLKAPTDDLDMLDSDTAWLARKAWASAVVRDSFAMTGGLIWGFALFWNLVSAPILFIIPRELDQGNQAILLALMFPIVGLVLLYWAVRKTREWRRFGPLTVTLNPYPGAIGGDVAGTIHLAAPLPAHTFVTVTLNCLHHSRSGKSSSQSIHWQESHNFKPLQSRRSTTVNFLFEVPEQLPSSELPDRSYYAWTLQVVADVAGVDLDRQVDIPVFPTGVNADGALRHSIARENHVRKTSHSELATKTATDTALNTKNVTHQNLLPINRAAPFEIVGANARINFRAGLLMGVIFMLFGVGMGYFIGYLENELIFLGAGILFACIGLLISFFTVRSRIRHHHLRLTKPTLEVHVKTLSATKTRNIPYHDILSVTSKSAGSLQAGGKHYELFTLNLMLKNGGTVRIGENLSRQQARQLSAELNVALGTGAVSSDD